jgi:hypothetical protein
MPDLGDFVPGLWLDPKERLPKMPRRKLLSGVRIIGNPYNSAAQLSGAYVKPIQKPSKAHVLFLPQHEPVLYKLADAPAQLCSATDDFTAPLATQLLLYVQRAAVKEHLSCAGRMAGGDAPDWCWFKQDRSNPFHKPDGSFAIETRFGLLVGNVYTHKPQLLHTAAAIRLWSRLQQRKKR